MEMMKTDIDQEAGKQTQQKIDFKMVTFSLAGKDYGIDIMKVKEISKVEKYTYMPNTFPYVLGVYNMRGDIISIIDMRKMFNLPVPDEAGLLNVIIINLDEYQLGIVVDAINKVVGVAGENIQPPPPLFTDINLEYLSGVVEQDDKLFLILNVDEIFREEETQQYEKQVKDSANPKITPKTQDKTVYEFNFIAETLATFKKFYVTDLNRNWVSNHFPVWKKQRNSRGEDFQLKNENDAEQFLATFYSANTGHLFGDDLKQKFFSLLPQNLQGPFNVWNSGCSRGHEAYSLAIILKLKYPGGIIKVWANDNDLLSISNAPNLVFKEIELPDYLKNSDLLEAGTNGYKWKPEVKDLIYFEYHDTLNPSAMPDLDLILARDILSFQNPVNQKKMLQEFSDTLKTGGILIIGDNEKNNEPGWIKLEIKGINVYKKES